MKLVRYQRNPILAPTKNWWETRGVFNPGVAQMGKEVILLYRAWGQDHLSRFGLATSLDGLKFKRREEPILEGDSDNEFERLGIEDPRITKIGSTYYTIYTAASVYTSKEAKEHGWARSLNQPMVPYRVRISLVTTQDFKKFHHYGPILEDFDTKDATLVPEKIKGYYFLIHRHSPNIWLSYSPNLVNWKRGHEIMRPEHGWEEAKIGAGSQPLETDIGWLVFYHGVDRHKVYRLGALLLDKENPSKVLKRTSKPIFEPEKDFEQEGNIPNVVFTCGVAELAEEYYLYYGAADTRIGLATVKKADLLKYLLEVES